VGNKPETVWGIKLKLDRLNATIKRTGQTAGLRGQQHEVGLKILFLQKWIFV